MQKVLLMAASLQGAECDTADDGAQCKAEGAQLPSDVGLVMILKNENATIHETLTSIRDGIDYWTIVDTGSTGTSSNCPSPQLLYWAPQLCA